MANINNNSTVLDIVNVHLKFYTHKQVERKGNLVFMRMKKRKINLLAGL